MVCFGYNFDSNPFGAGVLSIIAVIAYLNQLTDGDWVSPGIGATVADRTLFRQTLNRCETLICTSTLQHKTYDW